MSYLESTSDFSVGVATPSADADWIDVNRFATAVSKAIFAAARFVLAVPVSSVLLYTVLYDVSTLSLVSLTVLVYFSMDAASARSTIPSAKASSVKSFMLATVVFSDAAASLASWAVSFAVSISCFTSGHSERFFSPELFLPIITSVFILILGLVSPGAC